MRPLRRKERALSDEQTIDLLVHGEYGVLSTVGADGQPYGVPLSYIYRNNRIYFHCARQGHKVENLAAEKRVSFCVVGKTRILSALFTTAYESAVAFGLAEEVSGEERQQALIWLLEKYSREYIAEGRRYIAQKDPATRVFRIVISHIGGKARPDPGQ